MVDAGTAPQPEPAPDGGVFVGGGPLTREELRAAIQKHQGEVRRCYEAALKAKPSLTGKVSIELVIGADGKVTEAKAQPSELPASMVECIRAKVLRFEFPRPRGGGTVKVTYPWVFSAEAEPAP